MGSNVGVCFHCEEPCTEEDYCYGCKTFVCAKCEPYYEGPDGSHRPEEHLLYFGKIEDEGTCRYIVGRKALAMCGARSVFSAYCRDHLHAVIDERIHAGES